MVYYLLGVTSSIAVWIFIWAITRRNKNIAPTGKRDLDRNNTDIRSGLGSLRTNNKESGRIIDEAKDTAGRLLESLLFLVVV